MSLEIVPDKRSEITSVKNSIPTEHEMMVFNVMAKQAVASKMYRGVGDEAGVMMIMLAARELGIPPMQALNKGLQIIEGSVEISARMMSAMIRRAGHSITIKESTDERCVLFGRRCDNADSATVSYGVQDAQRAGLIKEKGGWKKVPKDMCFARAMSRLARQLFSDVIGIGYVEGEIRATDSLTVSSNDILEASFDIPELQDANEQEWIDKFLNLFDKEDKHLAMQYLRVVMKHFEWTAIAAIDALLKDQDRLFDKFNKWKSTIKKVEEV